MKTSSPAQIAGLKVRTALQAGRCATGVPYCIPEIGKTCCIPDGRGCRRCYYKNTSGMINCSTLCP